ncbi:uncharacterized protein [Rutidosis leptorrhynchoides]|uniref:uncharacterized protein n=1 Tax=Rutidosis leptorrhynchoides TaxID=125765 RepID=UPI003A99D905
MVEQTFIDEFFIAIKGKWKGKGVDSIIVNVYGPHTDPNKQKLWSSLDKFIGTYDLDWVLCGDFNEVRDSSERQNCEFIAKRVEWFNKFIDKSNLFDVPMGGKRFMKFCDNGVKFSKFDRFLVSEKFRATWGDLSMLALKRKMSDHCPIVLRDMVLDFGPKPMKVFDEWFYSKDASKIIEECWSCAYDGNRKDCSFRNKLKKVKFALKGWSKQTFGNLDSEIDALMKSAPEWAAIAETR